MIKPHGKSYRHITEEKEFRELAEMLYKHHPAKTCDWEMIHPQLQEAWVRFAKFAYMTVITTISFPEDSDG